MLIEQLRFKDHLIKTGGPEWESRWENCQELVSFAVDTEGSSTEMDDVLDDLGAHWADAPEEFDSAMKNNEKRYVCRYGEPDMQLIT